MLWTVPSFRTYVSLEACNLGLISEQYFYTAPVVTLTSTLFVTILGSFSLLVDFFFFFGGGGTNFLLPAVFLR